MLRASHSRISDPGAPKNSGAALVLADDRRLARRRCLNLAPATTSNEEAGITIRTRVLTVLVLAGVVAVSSALAGGRGT